MKRIALSSLVMLAFVFSLEAQQFVSTAPSNRNVILEDFTGRLCSNCPDGHAIANCIKANNPGRFWPVNIHSEGTMNSSTNAFPNLNTAKGDQIRAAFGVNAFPSGVVNRLTAGAVGRGAWTSYSEQQFNQDAECNVAGKVLVNPETRVADITVEVYYTGNSLVDKNYLTVVMLQDSIWGSQSYGQDNPEQWMDGQYCHMHILRDVITDVMGDEIAPTTQGTLVTRTYTYQIPEIIGDPNGVVVDLNTISFLAWVSERYQGAPTRPILNSCELDLAYAIDEPEQTLKIYPNPTSGMLNIQCEDMTNVEVYNAVGQRVMAQKVNGNKIQISTGYLNDGVYFIRVLTDSGVVMAEKVTIIR